MSIKKEILNPIAPTLPKKLLIRKNGTYSVKLYDSVLVNVTKPTDALNIHYGDNAPDDTSKLWIKGKKADKVNIGTSVNIIGNIVKAHVELNEAAMSMGVATVNKNVYSLGGSTLGGTLDSITEYDTESETIRVLEDVRLPKAISDTACVAVGEKIYCFGGFSSGKYLTDIVEFNTKAHECKTLTEVKLPVACSNMAAATIGTRIYLVGGYTENGKKLDTILEFDTESKALKPLKNTNSEEVKLPEALYGAGATAVGDIVYIVGGYTDKIYVLDTKEIKIEQLPVRLDKVTTYCGCVAIDEKIYILNGLSGFKSSNKILVLDTTDATISDFGATLPIEANRVGTVAVGGKIILLGGATMTERLKSIYSVVVKAELPENYLNICCRENGKPVTIFANDKASIEAPVISVYRGDKNGVAQPETAYTYDKNEGGWSEIAYIKERS